MKYLIDLPAVFILYIIQSVFGPKLAIYGIKPDLLYLYLCYRALEKGALPGSILGFFIGLLQGIYSPATLGAGSFAKTLAGMILGRSGVSIYQHDLPLRLLIIFGSLLGHDLIFFLVTDPSSIVYHFLNTSLYCGIYTTAVGGILGLLYYLANKLLSN